MAQETANNSIEVVTEYQEHSNAIGALYIFTTFDNYSSSLVPVTRNESSGNDSAVSFSLSAGWYTISVFDIEENGTLLSGVGYPAVRQELLLNGDTCMAGGVGCGEGGNIYDFV